LLAALLAIGAVVAALLIHGNGTGSDTTTATGSGGGAVHLRAVAADDRFGTGGEHDSDVGKATDDDPSTYWPTEGYRTAPELGKPGVGLVLDAGRPVELHELGVATGTPGFTAVVRAGSSPTTATRTISSSQTVDDGTTFELHSGAPYRYYEVWITRLGAGYDKAQLNEVRAT
jgi:hypothetical protein